MRSWFILLGLDRHCRRRKRTSGGGDINPRRRRANPSINTRRAFDLRPSLQVEMAVTHYTPPRAQPPHNDGDHREHNDDDEHSNDRTNRAAVRLLHSGRRRRLLVNWE